MALIAFRGHDDDGRVGASLALVGACARDDDRAGRSGSGSGAERYAVVGAGVRPYTAASFNHRFSLTHPHTFSLCASVGNAVLAAAQRGPCV
jgi:hypothetical protein